MQRVTSAAAVLNSALRAATQLLCFCVDEVGAELGNGLHAHGSARSLAASPGKVWAAFPDGLAGLGRCLPWASCSKGGQHGASEAAGPWPWDLDTRRFVLAPARAWVASSVFSTGMASMMLSCDCYT